MLRIPRRIWVMDHKFSRLLRLFPPLHCQNHLLESPVKSLVVFFMSITAFANTFASGVYDGIYQLGNSPTYWTVQQNGNNLIVGEFTSITAAGITLTTTTGVIVRPNNLDTWELRSGTISGNTAQLTGNSTYGACSQTISAVFDNTGTVRSTTMSMTNTVLGTTLGINCNSVMLQIQSTTGLSRTLTKVAF